MHDAHSELSGCVVKTDGVPMQNFRVLSFVAGIALCGAHLAHAEQDAIIDSTFGGKVAMSSPGVAASGGSARTRSREVSDDSFGTSTGGGYVKWNASPNGVDSGLKSIVQDVAANYGPVTVNSGCRSHGHNSRVGGADRSYHLSCNAIDFRVSWGNAGKVYSFLKTTGAGGIHHYGGGLFHIDNGPRRSW